MNDYYRLAATRLTAITLYKAENEQLPSFALRLMTLNPPLRS
ncbi:hypothetical protein TI01_0132 [Lysobacter sp. A03]|nr:hypothetical protein TI01_0132 [Lysobacter sp. A03]